MIDHSLVTGFTMFIRRSFDMTCFGISTYHRHEPPLANARGAHARGSSSSSSSSCRRRVVLWVAWVPWVLQRG